MGFRMVHNNLNVTDMAKSLEFYEKALELKPVRTKDGEDGSFKLAFLSDGKSEWLLELTWLKEHPQPYDLGENEVHLAVVADDYDKSFELHKQMGCVCYENTSMGIYFIEDPDGYWIEVIPKR